MGKLIFLPNDIPPLTSPFMDRLAKHFIEMKEWYHDARRPIEGKWRACDEAYLCYRILPDTGAIDFLDDSEFGETDAHDNANIIVIRMLQAILPPGMPYLNPAASDPDEPYAVTEAVRDFLMYQHRRAGTRRQLAKWLKMLVVRGDGAFYWEHTQEFVKRPVLGARERMLIEDALKVGRIKDRDAAQMTRVLEEVCVFNGPVIRVIDTHDYFLSPISDLTNKRREPFVIQTFRYLSDLVAEVDTNDKKVYGNLKGLEGSYARDLWGRTNDGQARLNSLRIMGLEPEADRGNIKLVPVYIVYVPYLNFEGKEFFDTYFHVALNSSGKGSRCQPRMIRVETNPTGQRQFLFDNYTEFFTNTPYGISGIEKSLPGLRQKNVLGALMFNAAVATQFPAQNVLADAFKDGEVSFMPGAMNEIANIGADPSKVMAPVPVPEKGLQLAWQDMKFWGDELRTKMGIDGLQADSPTRSASRGKGKTATEVNRDTSTGNLVLDEAAAKYSDTLTEFFQGSFDVMKDRVEPNAEGYLEYQRNINNRLVMDKLAMADFEKPRSITVGYMQGIFDKGQRLNNVTQVLGAVSQAATVMPNAPAIISDLVLEIARLNNVHIKPESMMTPEQLAAQDPQVQILALQSALQQIGASPSAMGGDFGSGGESL
jgi:hypothetical protein